MLNVSYFLCLESLVAYVKSTVQLEIESVSRNQHYIVYTMETLLGIAFHDYVLVAADMTQIQSIMVMKEGRFKENDELF